MDYYNVIIFILIFIIVLTSFYLIISNFGINTNHSTNTNTGTNTNTSTNDEHLKLDLEKKILLLKSELSSMEMKINPDSNLTNSKEIIIETDTSEPIINTKSINLENSNLTPNNKPPPIIYDPIANYDIAKLNDPLVDPRGRTSADQIPTPQVAMQFNFPTQGVLDRYHRVGLLIGINDNKNNSEYKNRPKKVKKNKKMELPFSTSELSNYSESTDSSIYSNNTTGTEFIWKGSSKTNKNKKNKKFVPMEINNSVSKTYNGIDIKENFNSDSDTDTDSDYDSRENFKNTNIYNIYSGNNDNNILELIGKKITDNWYKYFTSITMGNKIIKVTVHNKNRKELYSGDIIYISELKRTYRVKIDPMDMIEYNPYFF